MSTETQSEVIARLVRERDEARASATRFMEETVALGEARDTAIERALKAEAERDALRADLERKDALDKLRDHIESDRAGTSSYEPMMREAAEIERLSADAGLRAALLPVASGPAQRRHPREGGQAVSVYECIWHGDTRDSDHCPICRRINERAEERDNLKKEVESLRTQLAQARDAALEEAALVAGDIISNGYVVRAVQQAIRARKSQPPPSESYHIPALPIDSEAEARVDALMEAQRKVSSPTKLRTELGLPTKPSPEPTRYCERVSGCLWPEGHAGDTHMTTVSSTPPPPPPVLVNAAQPRLCAKCANDPSVTPGTCECPVGPTSGRLISSKPVAPPTCCATPTKDDKP